MKKLARQYLLAVTTSCLLLSAGCSQKKESTLPSDLTAEQYLNMAATADPLKKSLYEMAAANKLITQQKASQAKQVLSTLDPNLSPQQQAQKQLLQARLSLLNAQPQDALSILQNLLASNASLPQDEQVALYQLLANTYETLGNTLASIQSRMTLSQLLDNKQAKRLNDIAIWHTLQTQTPAQLEQLQSQAQASGERGWISLALITRTASTPNALVTALRRWESDYPNHDALSLLPPNITAAATAPEKTKMIALLLPLSGRYAADGTAIKNGFLAAYYAAQKHTLNLPKLKIYDTNNQSIDTVYDTAINNGANFIIGPLLKPNIQQLVKDDKLSAPTLALNTLADIHGNRYLYQFGLSPIDEAVQAANRASQAGYQHAVIIAANNTWGKTLTHVFSQAWQDKGGTIVDTLQTQDSQQLSSAISKLLNINLVNAEYNHLKAVLHTPIRFIPRRRHDIDFIYMVEQPKIARQIVPLLRYYFASDLPIYSVSQIYSGHNHTGTDRDLNGVIFCDMPWVLNPEQSKQMQNLRQQIKMVWPTSYEHYPKLYALGIDSYLILTKLPQLKALPQFGIAGATGELYLDQSQHIFRRLLWAKFKNGAPVLLK